jgi:hypothetical protein
MNQSHPSHPSGIRRQRQTQPAQLCVHLQLEAICTASAHPTSTSFALDETPIMYIYVLSGSRYGQGLHEGLFCHVGPLLHFAGLWTTLLANAQRMLQGIRPLAIRLDCFSRLRPPAFAILWRWRHTGERYYCAVKYNGTSGTTLLRTSLPRRTQGRAAAAPRVNVFTLSSASRAPCPCRDMFASILFGSAVGPQLDL